MHSANQVQPSIEQGYVAKQPAAQTMMNSKTPATGESTQKDDVLRLRGGCPGKFCGLPILPCRCDICIIPIPCC
ncbi:uncharacterized protein MKK02DRAFT_44707 [Dioszegia hungarica]|uniref:Uncharacterized protein n=1 Tax=Dioszegia hungarica TaxID=4972 RepID=A0AA38HBN2_9TREE|nr:uncharacterized protein MKK02DRAFT_44707 [Dioszegia hungarica]KAI9636009.1 hypothetical protein MKK02DRAFT_44707 [Dioszegia hungarica]